MTDSAKSLKFAVYKSPVGRLYLLADETSLHAVVFRKSWPAIRALHPVLSRGDSPVIRKAFMELDEYFAGRRKKFTVKCNPHGTAFQRRSWRVLQSVPYGSQISYSQQAAAMNAAGSFRAVGSANGKNPICIIIPCHRVIAADGTIGGYSGGLKAKQMLLNLENGYL